MDDRRGKMDDRGMRFADGGKRLEARAKARRSEIRSQRTDDGKAGRWTREDLKSEGQAIRRQMSEDRGRRSEVRKLKVENRK
jgi:hypothetical protein